MRAHTKNCVYVVVESCFWFEYFSNQYKFFKLFFFLINCLKKAFFSFFFCFWAGQGGGGGGEECS